MAGVDGVSAADETALTALRAELQARLADLDRTLAELGPEDPIRLLIAERAGRMAAGDGLL